MSALAKTEAGTLPALVRRAAQQLAAAETSAQVLEAKDAAAVAYDAAKKTARIAKAKRAHDEVITAVYRAQADALEIESLAKRRLADEYDAAQDRGEVKTRAHNQPASSVVEEAVSAAAIGLTHKDIHDARRVRDAEDAAPGIVRRSLDALIETGAEPTRAAVNRAISAPASAQPPKSQPRVSDSALWLWGRLRDFEARGLTRGDPTRLFHDMTDEMRRDVLRLAPLVSAFLTELENFYEPA